MDTKTNTAAAANENQNSNATVEISTEHFNLLLTSVKRLNSLRTSVEELQQTASTLQMITPLYDMKSEYYAGKIAPSFSISPNSHQKFAVWYLHMLWKSLNSILLPIVKLAAVESTPLWRFAVSHEMLQRVSKCLNFRSVCGRTLSNTAYFVSQKDLHNTSTFPWTQFGSTAATALLAKTMFVGTCHWLMDRLIYIQSRDGRALQSKVST